MELTLTCNNLKCRKKLDERAVVTACSHIFCFDCANRLGLQSQGHIQQAICPACNSKLVNVDEEVVTVNINPNENYRTSVLSGQPPSVIIECAGRALSFWAYQISQDVSYKEHLCSALTEKYSELNQRFEQQANSANTAIGRLEEKLKRWLQHNSMSKFRELMRLGFAAEYESLRLQNEELAKSFRDKSRRLAQVQELYNKVKRKAEMIHIQQAASNAVDSTLQGVPQLRTQDFDPHQSYSGHADGEVSRVSPALAASRNWFDITGRNNGVSETSLNVAAGGRRWTGEGEGANAPDMSVDKSGLQRPMATGYSMPMTSGFTNYAETPVPIDIGARPTMSNPSNFPQRRGLSAMGLTSGLRVSQSTNAATLRASARGS